jgi:hypothetical protein
VPTPDADFHLVIENGYLPAQKTYTSLFQLPDSKKKTIIQPLEAEIQMMKVIKLEWSSMHLRPTTIFSLSCLNNN